MSRFVIKTDRGFVIWKYGATTPDLQKARIFNRRCDAGNSLAVSDFKRSAEPYEVVEVALVEVPR